MSGDQPLREAGAAGAAAGNWTWVGGVGAAFDSHGLCSALPFVNSIADSLRVQVPPTPSSPSRAPVALVLYAL